jgi:hypothetical protein
MKMSRIALALATIAALGGRASADPWDPAADPIKPVVEHMRQTRLQAIDAQIAVLAAQSAMMRAFAATLPTGDRGRAMIDLAAQALDSELADARTATMSLRDAPSSEYRTRDDRVTALLDRADRIRADAWKQIADALRTRPAA